MTTLEFLNKLESLSYERFESIGVRGDSLLRVTFQPDSGKYVCELESGVARANLRISKTSVAFQISTESGQAVKQSASVTPSVRDSLFKTATLGLLSKVKPLSDLLHRINTLVPSLAKISKQFEDVLGSIPTSLDELKFSGKSVPTSDLDLNLGTIHFQIIGSLETSDLIYSKTAGLRCVLDLDVSPTQNKKSVKIGGKAITGIILDLQANLHLAWRSESSGGAHRATLCASFTSGTLHLNDVNAFTFKKLAVSFDNVYLAEASSQVRLRTLNGILASVEGISPKVNDVGTPIPYYWVPCPGVSFSLMDFEANARAKMLFDNEQEPSCYEILIDGITKYRAARIAAISEKGAEIGGFKFSEISGPSAANGSQISISHHRNESMIGLVLFDATGRGFTFTSNDSVRLKGDGGFDLRMQIFANGMQQRLRVSEISWSIAASVPALVKAGGLNLDGSGGRLVISDGVVDQNRCNLTLCGFGLDSKAWKTRWAFQKSTPASFQTRIDTFRTVDGLCQLHDGEAFQLFPVSSL